MSDKPRVGERWEARGTHGTKRREVVSITYTSDGRMRISWKDWMNPTRAGDCLESSWCEFKRRGSTKVRDGDDVVPNCASCRFWWDGPQGDTGTCRAQPPQIDQGTTVWSETSKTDWCGSWELRDG